MRKGIALFLALLMVTATAAADTVWTMCQPHSQVNIRARASGRSEIVGYATCGDDFETDGKTRGGFLHVFAPVEAGEGWIALGYIVRQKPVYVGQRLTVDASGRVKARRTIGGKRRCWLQPGDEIMVYWAADWAVTDKGFVRADCIGGW